MFAEMLRFEWRYHVYRLVFVLCVVVVAGMAFALVATGYGAQVAQINAPTTVMQACGLLSLWLLFSQTLFTVNGVLRDDEHGMRALILSRPIGRFGYLASRYLGVVLAGLMVFTIAVLLLMVAPHVLSFDASRVGPFSLTSYAFALGTLILPNLLLVSALLCAVAWFTRSTIATYAGGIAVFGFYMVTALLVDSPLMAGTAPPTAESLARAALLDPFGISAFFEQVRYWTTAERNMQMLTLDGRYLQNRLLVLAITGVTLAVCYRFVSLGARATNASRARLWRTSSRETVHERVPGDSRGNERGNVPTLSSPVAYLAIAPTSESRGFFLRAFVSTVWMELRQLFASRVLLALLLLFMVVAGVEASTTLMAGDYGTRVLATSGALAASVPLQFFGMLCVVYFGADLVWRERATGISGLVDATPTSNAVFALGKLVALALLPFVLEGAGLCVALLVHVGNGGLPIQPLVYLAQFWFAAYPLALFAVLVVALQVLSPNRWVGMLAAFLLALLSLAGAGVGLEHPMLRFAAAPAVSYSDLDGYGAPAASFAAFMLYWTAASAALAVVSWGAWRRGRDPGVRERLAGIWRGNSGGARRGVALAGTVFAIVGAALFWQTNVLHSWESVSDGLAWQADYERSYRRLAGVPQPAVTHVDIAVDFTPRARRAQIRGTLTLHNRSALPIDTVWIAERRDASYSLLELAGATEVARQDRFGMRAFALQAAMQPGDSSTLLYALTLDRSGIRADGFSQDIAANGSYLTMSSAMPAFGYRSGYEISDRTERSARHLGPATAALLPHASIDSLTQLARTGARPNSWFTVHATLSTTDAQTALGPGTLERTWTDGDRRYFDYRVSKAMPPRFAFASGRYAVERVQQDSVTVELWYHPGHARNVSRVLHAATQALSLLGSRFGEYPSRTLRLIELPAGWPFAGFAMGGMLLFTEDRGLLTDVRASDVDLLTRRVAHEVAHQWWGYVVDPLHVLGASVIVETLAKYSEQLVVEAEHGTDALPAMIAVDHDRYLSGRAVAAEQEAILVEASVDEAFLDYGKGAVAMHDLRQVLGDSAITVALRTLIARDGGPTGAATAPMLHALLREQALTTAARWRVDEWFSGRVLYDLRVDSASAVPEGVHYRVHARFSTRRVTVGENAERVEAVDGELFDVDILGDDGGVLFRGTVHARDGAAELSAVVLQRPNVVRIDPSVRRLDRERSNNRRIVLAADEPFSPRGRP